MPLRDELRMDRTAISLVPVSTPSDAKEFWRHKTMQERLAALEFTRQVFYGYDPATTRFQRVLEVVPRP